MKDNNHVTGNSVRVPVWLHANSRHTSHAGAQRWQRAEPEAGVTSEPAYRRDPVPREVVSGSPGGWSSI